MSRAENPVVFLVKKLWQYSVGRRNIVVAFFTLYAFSNAADFVRPLVVSSVLNAIQSQGIHESNLRSLLLKIALFPLLTLVIWAFHGPARILERKNAFYVRARYKKFLLDGTLALPASWHADHHSGDTIDRVNRGSEALFSFSENIFEVIYAVLMLVSSVGALLYFDLTAGLIAIVSAVVAFAVVMVYDAKLTKQYDQLYKADNGIAAKIFDVLSNVVTVIVLRLEKLASKDIFAKIMQPYALFAENAGINEWKWFWVSVSGAVMKVLVLGSFLIAAARNESGLAVGTVFLLYAYAERVESVFFQFANTYSGLVQKRAQVANAEELADAFQAAPRQLRAGVPDWKHIELTGLDFSYDGAGKAKHLTDVSFSFKRGEKIALVGASGSGKTTLLKMLRGLYVAERAEMRVNGKLEPRGLAVLRDAIALVPQEPEIFASTIRENITLGIDYTDKEVAQCAWLARFTDVVERLPNGYASSIFEKGVNLSGGEKQRLALTRGLLAAEDKSVLLLDEPTSSVDTKNEFDIYQNIFTAFPDKAVVSSIHRLHLLPMFDTIYFFKGGRIVASGGLKHLLKANKEFEQLWKKHAATTTTKTRSKTPRKAERVEGRKRRTARNQSR